jgi:hypothetical protein
MGVGEAFLLSGQIYVMGAAIALGMAALIKFICFMIDRGETKNASESGVIDNKGGEI